jgi:hypothetical protein
MAVSFVSGLAGLAGSLVPATALRSRSAAEKLLGNPKPVLHVLSVAAAMLRR